MTAMCAVAMHPRPPYRRVVVIEVHLIYSYKEIKERAITVIEDIIKFVYVVGIRKGAHGICGGITFRSHTLHMTRYEIITTVY